MAHPLDSTLSVTINETATRLSRLGFKKNGRMFRLISGGNAVIVDFQKSTNNTSDKLSFTANLAVVCGLLLDPGGVTVQKSRSLDGHLRWRIGEFTATRQDKWWVIDGTTDGDALAKEVASLIEEVAASYILRYVDTGELLALWESGQSPGLTEGARVRHLKRLKAELALTSSPAPPR